MIVSHANTAQRTVAAYDPQLGPTCLGAALLLLLVVGAAFVPGEDFVQTLAGVSSKLRFSEVGFGTIAIALLAGVLLAAFVAYLYVAHRTSFYFLLIASFSISEILIAALSYVSLALRYTCMLVLVTGALVNLTSRTQRVSAVQALGMSLLIWIIVRVASDPLTPQTLATLPVYAALLFGILVGLEGDFADGQETNRLGAALALTGILLTPIHLSAVWLAPEPFLGGRFRSFHVLPTAFANTYVILVAGMTWYAMSATAALRRVVAAGCALLGAGLLALSATRNATIVLGACTLFLAVSSPNRWRYLGLLTAIAALVVLGDLLRSGELVASALGRLASIDFANRQEVWSLSWQRVLEHPIGGSGLSAGSGSLLGAAVEEWEAATYINTHNAYMGIWLQLGLIGLIPVLCIYALTLYRGVALSFGGTLDLATRKAIALPTAMAMALALAGIAEENLTSRGSLQQIAWALSVIAINSTFLATRRAPRSSAAAPAAPMVRFGNLMP